MFHDIPFRLSLHVFDNFFDAVVVGGHFTVAVSLPLLLLGLVALPFLFRKRLKKLLKRKLRDYLR